MSPISVIMMKMERTDQELVADYLEGDDTSLAVLVDRHLPAVYNFALSLVHDSQMADDIAQESFIKAWKNIRRFISTKSFQTWLFSIAHNTAIDTLRQKRDVAFSAFENAEGENTLTATMVDDSPLPSELLQKAQDATFVQRLLQSLDPQYQDVLTLRYQNDMTFKEIGEALKKPLHTVKSQHRRALASLRRALKTRAV